jgi:hypothetical protein
MSDWSVDSDVRRFGSRSMRCLITSPPGVRTAYPVENDAGADVAVTPDTGYILTVYVNTGALPVNADIALKVMAEGSTSVELTELYIDTSESITRDTAGKGDEGWQRLILRFATTQQSRVRPMVQYGGVGVPTVGDTFWIDAMQMEESPIPTPWRPGMVGNAAVLDLNGLLIDGTQGGILRLRDAAVPTSRQASLLDVLDAIYPSMMRQERDTDQTITAGTVTTIAFNNLVKQDDERDDLAINTPTGGEVTINRAGWYRCDAGIFWEGNDTGRREMFVRGPANITVAGAVTSAVNFSATIGIYLSASTGPIYMAVGDVFRVQVRHSASTNIKVLASRATFITVTRLRA